MPKFILIKTRTTRVADLVDLATKGSLVVNEHKTLADALEELVYDHEWDWIILTAIPGRTSSQPNVSIARHKDLDRYREKRRKKGDG